MKTSLGETKEEEILAGILEGDETVLKSIYTTQLPVIKNFVLKNSGTSIDAEDVFQEAISVIYLQLKSKTLKLNCSVLTYLYALSKNIWLNILRRKGVVVYDENWAENSTALVDTILNDIHDNERKVFFARCFQQLDPKCQEVMKLFLSGESMASIAKSREYTISYVRKKKFECKGRLIKIIENHPLFKELKSETKQKETK